MAAEPSRICKKCACSWRGGPECWNCGTWNPAVACPMMRDIAGPKPEAVGEPLTL